MRFPVFSSFSASEPLQARLSTSLPLRCSSARLLAAPRCRYPLHPQLRMRLAANAAGKPVFQCTSSMPVSLYDIQDCFEATRDMRASDRREYFLSHGIDYDNVLNYYDVVKTLNNTLGQAKHPQDSALLDAIMQGMVTFAAALGISSIIVSGSRPV